MLLKIYFLSIIEEKMEFRRYKFENLLIEFLISRQKYCSSIAAEKSEMWRQKSGKLLIAFSICRHHNCSPLQMEKVRLGGTKFGNLLIASPINRQRTKMSSQNQPFSAFYTKNRPFSAFSLSKMWKFLLSKWEHGNDNKTLNMQ